MQRLRANVIVAHAWMNNEEVLRAPSSGPPPMSTRSEGRRALDRAKCLAALACGVGLLVAANAGMSAYSSYAKWSTMPVVYYLNPANATLSFAAVEVAVQRAA